MRRATDYGVYLIVRSLICVIQSLPESACERLSDGLALLFCKALRIRHNVVEDNLRHAFPEMDARERARIELGMWRHLFRLICEVALAKRKIHETNWRSYVTLHNSRLMVRTLIENRPTVVVTAHHGNFEMTGFLSGLLGVPTHTIARTLDNPYLHRFLKTFRESTGQYIIPTKGTGELVQNLIQATGIIGLLGDHYGGKKGCWVEFFNRPASCHKAIAVFSLANSIPLMVAYAVRSDRLLHFDFTCPAVFDPQQDSSIKTIPELTRWYNQHIENVIRKNPDQYWWLHRRWKDPRKSSKAPARAAG